MNIALRVALATSLVCITVFALVYGGLVHQSRTALQATIDTDIDGLADAYHAQGLPGLRDRLQERLDLAPTAGERPVYLLLDRDNKRLIGNGVWPNLDASVSQAGIIDQPGLDTGNSKILARVTQFKGGVRLMVGRSLRLSDSALGETRLLFLGGLILIAVCAFFIGVFAARSLRSRVATLNAVFDSLHNGDLNARTPISPRNDELDALASHVNLTLDRIERLLRAQREVSDNLAHEVRTPLTALSQRLEDTLALTRDPAAIRNLELAQEQVRTTLRLHDDLLDIASAEAQRGDLRALADIDLSGLARGLCDLYAASAEDAGMTLESRIEDGVTVRANAMQMSRLMVNLFDNALKYGLPGKALRFALTAGPVITLEDEGPGIPDADKQRVFERYQRVGGQTGVTGHGLGLALVAAIAARHNLTVRVEDTTPNELHKGARFIVMPEGTA